jgi:hypothetical protein
LAAHGDIVRTPVGKHRARKPELNRDRVHRQVTMSRRAFEIIEERRTHLGMTQKELCSRVIEWFAEQPEEASDLILGRLAERYCVDAALRMARRALELRGVDPNQIPLSGVPPSVRGDRAAS